MSNLELHWTPRWFGFGPSRKLQLLWEIWGKPTRWVFRLGPWQLIRRKNDSLEQKEPRK